MSNLHIETRKNARKNAIILESKEHNFWITKNQWNRIKRRETIQKMEFTLAPEDILQLWIQQEGRCAVTGLPLKCDTVPKTTWSVDRTNNELLYSKNNTQLVHKAYNITKGIRSDEDMKLMAVLIYQNMDYTQVRKLSNLTNEQIEEKLKSCRNVRLVK